ncbi:MAG TPA: hypothetical protein VNY27_10910 [Solirubrobacteraceae bacterium]|nr:hypothetical protein [Solirubrobacteraceae bacterium]
MLSDLLVGDRRLALVGLAKNTGKTETLAALLRELAERNSRIGVTSIGRDGEEHDVIDARIDKPRILLQAGDLVASTAALVRASGVAHERLTRTGVRTPLGEVVIARLAERGTIEVAGPSAAADVREVSDAMLDLGVEQVLIDGAIDRRAASSPAVADGLVMATGAILAAEIETVVAITRDAVDLVRLPQANGDGVWLEGRLVLNAEPDAIAALLREHPHADTFLVQGALGERFLEGLLAARRERAGRELRIVAADPTKVFLSRRGPEWYKRQGLTIGVLRTIGLRAITVNPVAPQSHAFDSRALRESLEAAIADVPVLDVRDPSYLALAK